VIFLTADQVNGIIEKSPEGRNTNFLKAAHSLWFRFKNYDKAPPVALEVDNEIVSIIFATYNRSGYTNLYEIVTVQGKEGKGYASKIWEEYISYAVKEKRSDRLKISCTPSSVTWHMRNGLLFWAVDPTGSLRSDQKLFPTRKEQLEYQQYGVNNPTQVLPPEKVIEQFLSEGLENHNFGTKKKTKVEEAINSVGKYWLRSALYNNSSLESFLS
jgi:hypothetical protein